MAPWTVARQAPQSMEFSRQEYWSGLPWPSPGDLPNPGIEPGSPSLEADSYPLSYLGNALEVIKLNIKNSVKLCFIRKDKELPPFH